MVSLEAQQRAPDDEVACVVRASVTGGASVEKWVRRSLGQAASETLSMFLGSFARKMNANHLFLLTLFLLVLPLAKACGEIHVRPLLALPAAFVLSFVIWTALKLAVAHADPRETRVSLLRDAMRLEFPGDPTVFVPMFTIVEWGFDPEVDGAYGRNAALVIQLGSGELIRMQMTSTEASALAAALHAALQREQTARNVLARGGRTLAEWRAALRAASQEQAYRGMAPPLTTAVLQRILSDKRSPEEHRVGAALALSATEDLDVKQGIRIAAAESDSARLRVALSRIADDAEDDGLEEAVTQATARRRVP